MLYALSHPAALAVLVLSFVIGMTLHGWVQSWVAHRLGDPIMRREGRLKADPRVHLEPFSAVGALLSGLGWAKPVEPPLNATRRQLLAITVSGPLVNLMLGVGLLLLWRAVSGPGMPLAGGAATYLQRGLPWDDGPGALLLLAGASQLYLGALSLLPLPPLDGGRLLFGLAPHSAGWQRARYQLIERNIGVAVLLALLVIPLGTGVPVIPQLLDSLLAPLLRLLTGS